jgi:hypothetical protein
LVAWKFTDNLDTFKGSELVQGKHSFVAVFAKEYKCPTAPIAIPRGRYGYIIKPIAIEITKLCHSSAKTGICLIESQAKHMTSIQRLNGEMSSIQRV